MNEYVEAHKNQPAINKLLHNEPITADDYKELERIFTEELGTAEDYQTNYQDTPFGLLIRKIAKMDRDAAYAAFSTFIAEERPNTEQIHFIEQVADKPQSYYGFEILYWCGLRIGELLALTPKDFDFENNVLKITKSYKKVKGKDIVTDPKTPKSIRDIVIPEFLAEEIKEYLASIYGIKENDRIFQNSKSYFRHEMIRGSKAAGVKRIRIHDLRHSHVSYLINKGYTALAIADRLGHEAVDITYKYAHLFPTVQTDMAKTMDAEREALLDECEEQ